MSYELRNNEAVADGVRRIVREEISAATERLKAQSGQDRDVAVHEVRKSVKKVRGLLRLMRPGLGEAYSRETAAWREIGQSLSELRDATAIIAVFDDVRGKYDAELSSGVRRSLVARKRSIEKAGNAGRILGTVAGELKRAERRVKHWLVEGEGAEAVTPGLRHTYGQGKKALRLARKDPTSENLHDFRKKVKAHLYQVRLLGGLWDKDLGRHEKQLGKLEEILGEHHNLHVLKGEITGQRGVEPFLQFLDKLEEKLAHRALQLGLKTYDDAAGKLAKHVERLWREWAK